MRPSDAEHFYDIVTVSVEIEEIDMVEYLNPVDFGPEVAEQMAKAYPALGAMQAEELFVTIVNIELLYFKNLQKKRADMVAAGEQKAECQERGQQAHAVLNGVFTDCLDPQSGEQVLSLNRLNEYLSNNPNKHVMISNAEFQMVCLVMNNCNVHKPQKILRNTFVNFFLLESDRQIFDYSPALTQMLDFSRNDSAGDDHLKRLFDNVRPQVSKDAFEKTFKADPRSVQQQANLIGNFIQQFRGGAQPQQPAGPPSVADSRDSGKGSISRMVFTGGAVAVKESLVESYKPAKEVPEYDRRALLAQQNLNSNREVLASFGNPRATPSPVITLKFDPPQPQQAGDQQPPVPSGASRGLPPQPGAPAKVATFGPMERSVGMVDEFEELNFQRTFENARRPPLLQQVPDPVLQIAKRDAAQPMIRELEVLNDSSFMDYEEVRPGVDSHRRAEELKGRMDLNVRHNLRKYEYDF